MYCVLKSGKYTVHVLCTIIYTVHPMTWQHSSKLNLIQTLAFTETSSQSSSLYLDIKSEFQSLRGHQALVKFPDLKSLDSTLYPSCTLQNILYMKSIVLEEITVYTIQYITNLKLVYRMRYKHCSLIILTTLLQNINYCTINFLFANLLTCSWRKLLYIFVFILFNTC